MKSYRLDNEVREQLDCMLVIIAHEAQTVGDFARRAVRVNSSLAKPATDAQLVLLYLNGMPRNAKTQKIERELRAALALEAENTRKAREQLWGRLVKSVDSEDE